MPAILFSAFCSAGNIFLLLLLDKTNMLSPSIQHLPILCVYRQLPWSVHFIAHFLVRCDSSLLIMKTILTKMICAFALDVIPAYLASVTLLEQDLCTRSLETPHPAHGCQARSADHRANRSNELFKPAVKHSRLLGVFNICASWHLQIYIIHEKTLPFNSSLFPSNSVAYLHSAW